MLERNKIYCGNCLELMKEIPDKSIDLVLADPPYNAQRLFANDNLTENAYTDFTNKWLSECARIIKGDIVIIIGVKYQKPIVLWLFQNLNFCWEFIWWKSNGMLNGKATFAVYDKVLWFSQNEGKHKRHPDIPRDVWNIPVIPQANDFGHPTPKSMKGIKNIVKLLSEEGDLILDPFLGSGTTAVACKSLNRDYIGIEISPEYCEIARRRLKHVQMEMFL